MMKYFNVYSMHCDGRSMKGPMQGVCVCVCSNETHFVPLLTSCLSSDTASVPLCLIATCGKLPRLTQ